MYARHLPPHPDVAFAMPFTLDDEGKEDEVGHEKDGEPLGEERATRLRRAEQNTQIKSKVCMVQLSA